MTLAPITVPYMAGESAHPASRGALRLAAAAGFSTAQLVEATVPEGSPLERSLAVNRPLAAAARAAARRGDVPLVLTGSCDSCLGLLAGVRHDRCGVVWIDAHGDFNTPETSPSGFIPGMCLACCCGHFGADAWATVGDNTPIAERHVLMYGTRDLDPLERVRLERSAVTVVEWRDGQPRGDLRAPLDALLGRVEAVYLHIDLDGLDPTVAPGTYDHPVPGGLSLAQLDLILDGLRGVRLAGATIATYNPERDVGDGALRAALHIVERLAAG
jgi:arginase